RCDGGGRRRPLCQGRRAGLAQGSRIHVPGRVWRSRRAGVPRDRAPEWWRLVSVRSRRGGAATGVVAGGGCLCRGRPGSAVALVEDHRWRSPVARPDEVTAIAFSNESLSRTWIVGWIAVRAKKTLQNKNLSPVLIQSEPKRLED